MMSRLTLAAILASLPAALAAQSHDKSAGVLRPPQLAALAPSRVAIDGLAAVCDGSEMRRTEQRRRTSHWLATGVAAAELFLTAANSRTGLNDPSRGKTVLWRQAVIVGVGFPALMGALAYGRPPGAPFWEGTISSMRVGETRSAEVRTCLREPPTSTSAGHEERWTYAWQHRGQLHTVSLTFKDSVLAEVRRAQVKLPLGHETAATVPVDIIPLLPQQAEPPPTR